MYQEGKHLSYELIKVHSRKLKSVLADFFLKYLKYRTDNFDQIIAELGPFMICNPVHYTCNCRCKLLTERFTCYEF